MWGKKLLLLGAVLLIASQSWAGKRSFRSNCLAATQGDVEAAYNLGWMYFNGQGVRHNADLAAGWFKRAAKLGDRHSANMLRLLAKATPKDDEYCLRMGRAPRPERSQVEAWVQSLAPEYGLDPVLVLEVIAAESAFDPLAKSPKGATGLMQLMPATAKRFNVDDIWDPEDNLHGGMAYLRWLLRYYKGDVTRTLAAYNAGEGAVDRYGGIPPFAETRQYVKRITGRYPLTTHSVPEAPRIAGAD